MLERVFSGSGGRPITVAVSIPVKSATVADEWSCVYRIDGLIDDSGNAKTRQSFGVDGIQALLLALTYVSTTLYTSADYEEGDVIWEGAPFSGDLGLPVVPAITDMLRERQAQ